MEWCRGEDHRLTLLATSPVVCALGRGSFFVDVAWSPCACVTPTPAHALVKMTTQDRRQL